MWNHFKKNQTIQKYIPDYNEGELPERNFFIEVLSTVYPNECENLIKAAFKARKSYYNNVTIEMIELTEEVKKELESIISYKSKL